MKPSDQDKSQKKSSEPAEEKPNEKLPALSPDCPEETMVILPEEVDLSGSLPSTTTDILDSTDPVEDSDLPTIQVKTVGEDTPAFTASETGGTEEVFVILPEGDSDVDKLPVVEPITSEDRAWDAGLTTDVLKELPADLSAPESAVSTTSIEDVGLVKVNPLSELDIGLDDGPAETESLEGMSTEDLEHGEEIEVIDEIAGIDSDLELEGDEAPFEGGLEVADLPGVLDRKDGAGRKRSLLLGASLAALVLAGVFFRAELLGLYNGYFGEPEVAVVSVESPQTDPPTVSPAIGTVGEVPPVPENSEATEIVELRSMIQLAMQVGLRANAGKE